MTRKRGVASSVRSILTLHNHELILLSNLHVKEEMISYNGFFKIDSFQKIQDSFRVYFLVMDPTLGATGQRKGKGGKNHLGCFLPSPQRGHCNSAPLRDPTRVEENSFRQQRLVLKPKSTQNVTLSDHPWD